MRKFPGTIALMSPLIERISPAREMLPSPLPISFSPELHSAHGVGLVACAARSHGSDCQRYR
jgi:hypothetical protein